ncbi:DinB family protein [Haliscomenobacter sp.]|uniref:DinB family protein n=1 Tax=Haliscomenobacter sp. TaxID=2717303 RepID=UPI00359323D0
MKILMTVLLALVFTGALTAQTLTKTERKEAVKYIKWCTKELKKSLKGLSEAQLSFKPAADRWSPQDCMYHIAFSEGTLRGALDQALNAPADPKAKAELKATDEEIKAGVVSRTNKVKTAEPFQPENTGYKSLAEAIAAFDGKRAMLIELVKTTNADLCNHIVALPFGKMDAYQFILFIAGHSNRHTQQINEVKTVEGYPGS